MGLARFASNEVLKRGAQVGLLCLIVHPLLPNEILVRGQINTLASNHVAARAAYPRE
jgi:hypothetical protein